MRQRWGREDGGKGLEVGNRTESQRLEVGGSGVEISFYGRVTNLRTRHCRVPADGRTMRLRNTMLHSGNLKAVLTTNLQPPIPLCAPFPSSVSPHLRLPILIPSTHTTPRLPAASPCHPWSLSLLSHSFAFTFPFNALSLQLTRSCVVRATIFKFTSINLRTWHFRVVLGNVR